MNEKDFDLVRHIARLAQLDIEEDNIDDFSRKFTSIIDYFNILKTVCKEELPSIDVVGEAHQQLQLAEDEPSPSLPLREALRNAPEICYDHFEVPLVLRVDKEETE